MRASAGICLARRSQRGAAAVEFALVSVILLTLVFGIIQVAFMLWAQQAASYAANAAARRNAVAPHCTGLPAYVENLVGPAGHVVQASALEPNPSTGRIFVVVKLEPINAGLALLDLGDDLTVRATAVTQIENDSNEGGPC